MSLELGGTPDEWIARDGLPAAILGDAVRDVVGGLPSAEDDDGFKVFEFMMIAWRQDDALKPIMMFPRLYGSICEAFVGGLVPLHHQPTQRWAYRPCIYRWHITKMWERQGSQRELDWRYSLYKMYEAIDSGVDGLAKFLLDNPLPKANKRAEAMLRSMLSPTQEAELVMRSSFRVIGGATGRYYRIEPGNGFAHVHSETNAPITNYCLHPEDWMPDADVALACKLNLECPDLEEETVAGANARPRDVREEVSPEHMRELQRATDMEREFIAAPA